MSFLQETRLVTLLLFANSDLVLCFAFSLWSHLDSMLLSLCHVSSCFAAVDCDVETKLLAMKSQHVPRIAVGVACLIFRAHVDLTMETRSTHSETDFALRGSDSRSSKHDLVL